MTAAKRKSRRITVGNVAIGGGAPVAVQSMTKTQTEETRATVAQIKKLEAAGCELIRIAVPNRRALKSFGEIREKIKIPVIADIHFNKELALGAFEHGADCVRVNPGNIGGRGEFRAVAIAARNLGRAVRIGVNSGSLDPKIKNNKRLSDSEKLVESALLYIETAEKAGLKNFKVSLKASDVLTTVAAYRGIARLTDAPLHVGVTEAGDAFSGAIKSGVGIGILLNEGIGDTIRVSLSAPPEAEVRAAWEILRSLGLRRRGVEIISCPTCSRTKTDIGALSERIREKTVAVTQPLRIAVMGCEVNGPGESEGADLALVMDRAGGARLYAAGKLARKVAARAAVAELLKEMDKLIRADAEGRPEEISCC
ncbi:MAG: flavodoxin-dependent (E)-4-hydroxy-3-methylbut-2-enyl-diphosphate synthase [bacterium]